MERQTWSDGAIIAGILQRWKLILCDLNKVHFFAINWNFGIFFCRRHPAWVGIQAKRVFFCSFSKRMQSGWARKAKLINFFYPLITESIWNKNRQDIVPTHQKIIAWFNLSNGIFIKCLWKLRQQIFRLSYFWLHL